ncbi:PerC family transcriptional regulator [Lelliottia sp. V106_10]|uniref:PerC family transcriptional regulator n=1 Tax=Lelliottia wanjuensis TaxID=3050585 RepID=UPI00254C79A4|nr:MULTISPECIES: PerC family transcriptional regulator [unclassified Lelliottia]MDK9354853.1 PerC family transcriptional regulator [Lelliottia sp. V106_16]MDK9372061.1 PerC family transcriptional regulator [Lelliottia sp. V106_10]MDK9598697.1 PerC family transcriptional regulator [Lelliottia sp. V106_5]
MPETESLTPTEATLLNDSIAQALERAGLWRRAATRWLLIFDKLDTDYAREQIALRREACLLMSGDITEDDTGAKRRKSHRLLQESCRT